MMKNQLTLTALLTAAALFANAQNGFPNYYVYRGFVTRADSLYTAKDYMHAAGVYLQATQVQLEKAFNYNFEDEYYNAACCYALAGKTNKALDQLQRLITKCNFSNYDTLVADKDLVALHASTKWNTLAQQVKNNSVALEKQKKFIAERTTYSGKPQEVIFQPHNETVRKYLDNDSLPFISVNHQNFRIYFRGNSFAAYHLAAVKDSLDKAFQRVLEVCHQAIYHRGINMIMVDSAGESKDLTGFYIHGGMSMPEAESVLVVYHNEKASPFTHEMFHFVANDIWGNNASRVLQEGGAVYAECTDGALIDTIVAGIIKEQKYFALSHLVTLFDDKAKENEIIAYFEGASAFKFLYEKYGIQKLKQLWLDGFEKFETIYGQSTQNFEKEWKAYIAAINVPPNFDWEKAAMNTP